MHNVFPFLLSIFFKKKPPGICMKEVKEKKIPQSKRLFTNPQTNREASSSPGSWHQPSPTSAEERKKERKEMPHSQAP